MERDRQQIFWGELGHAPDPLPTVEQQLFDIKQQLNEMQTAQQGGEHPPPVAAEPSPQEEKEMKFLKKEKPSRFREKLLIISDLQLLGEANEEGIGALLEYIKAQGSTFTHVVLNGDIVDFRQQTGFKSDNQMGDSVTIDEQVAGRWFIDFIGEKMPQAKKIFMKGNHEDRYKNMYMDTTNGVQQWLRPFEEVFRLDGWEVFEYGKGNAYDWHGRKIAHGHKGGAKTNIPKIMMEENMRPNSVGHVITNRFWEIVDADGNSMRSYVHAGFSKPAVYDKSGDKRPSNGFGVYYYDKVKGKEITNEYMIIIPANHSRFISPEGDLYDGVGFNLRQEIGLDPRGRGRPRKR